MRGPRAIPDVKKNLFCQENLLCDGRRPVAVGTLTTHQSVARAGGMRICTTDAGSREASTQGLKFAKKTRQRRKIAKKCAF